MIPVLAQVRRSVGAPVAVDWRFLATLISMAGGLSGLHSSAGSAGARGVT
jgi:hypothetical protein